MRKDVLLAITAFAFLAGCDNLDNKPYGPPPEAKLKAPYHLEFDAKAPKANPTGVALPSISFTANPNALERRAALVVRFDATGAKNDQPAKDRFVAQAIDIPGTGGKLPDNYIDSVDQGLAKLLKDRCMKGTVKVSVALVRSTIRPDPDETELNAKRLSDWVPAEISFKNPHPKCELGGAVPGHPADPSRPKSDRMSCRPPPRGLFGLDPPPATSSLAHSSWRI